MKLLLALLVLAGLAAAAALVPVRGKTLLARWEAAPSAGAFLSRGMDEVAHALKSPAASRSAPAPSSAPGHAARTAERPAHLAPGKGGPAERHSEEDRAAVDRIVSQAAR